MKILNRHIAILVILLVSCAETAPTEIDVHLKIAAYYKHVEVKQYIPLRFSTLDTVSVNGNMAECRIMHTFKAEAKDGTVKRFRQRFAVFMWPDTLSVVPLPR